MLEDQGAEVTAFASAEEALRRAEDVQRPRHRQRHRHAADGRLPVDARAARADETAASGIPALALTAFARAEDRKRALLAGFQAHLAKPFDVAELMLMLADLAGRESRPRPDPIGANPDDNAQR